MKQPEGWVTMKQNDCEIQTDALFLDLCRIQFKDFDEKKGYGTVLTRPLVTPKTLLNCSCFVKH